MDKHRFALVTNPQLDTEKKHLPWSITKQSLSNYSPLLCMLIWNILTVHIRVVPESKIKHSMLQPLTEMLNSVNVFRLLDFSYVPILTPVPFAYRDLLSLNHLCEKQISGANVQALGWVKDNIDIAILVDKRVNKIKAFKSWENTITLWIFQSCLERLNRDYLDGSLTKITQSIGKSDDWENLLPLDILPN